MVRHIVMFKLKDKDPAIVAEAVKRLKSLEGKIEGLLSVEVGADCVHSERSCDVCLNTVFDTMASLERYRTHPAHLPVQAYMHSVRESSVSADYEMD